MDIHVRNFCKIIKNEIHPNDKYELSDDVNWSYMVDLARSHQLFPVFLEGAIKHNTYIQRAQYQEEATEALMVVATQMMQTNSFLKLYTAFAEKGIYPIVMKGLICRQLYGALSEHRVSADEDILIRPSEYWVAKEILLSKGYICDFSSETEAQLEKLQEVTFIHPTEEMHIELHLNPLGRENELRARMTDCFQDVFENYREVDINGVRIRTMSHQKHLLFLILHAFRHFLGGGFGIRQMLDILMYQDKYGKEVDMDCLKETLKSLNADVFWADLIHIGNEYFGFQLPVSYEPNCPEQMLEDMIQCGVFGNTTQAQRTAIGTTMLATDNYDTKNSINYIVMIWKSIFPSRAYLINQYPYLVEKPWLLPIEWVKRWGRFLKHNKDNDKNLAMESLKITRRRIKLLKKYNLV